METNDIKAGCGVLNEAQFDQLSEVLAELEKNGMSAEFTNGVACGLGFVSIEDSETAGLDFQEFVKNAYLNFMFIEAMKDARFGLAELLKGMGLK